MVFKNALKTLAQLKLFLVPILLFFWISSVFEHFLIKQIELVINSMDPSTFKLIGLASLHLLNGILFPTLVTLLALSFIRNRKQGSDRYQIEPEPSEQLFIETLRSWGKMIWWFFALIVPGIYKFIAYAYVPIVVFLDPSYEKGQTDALHASEKQFRKRWWVTVLIFVFPIMLSSFLDSYKDFNDTPILALLVSGLNGVISLFAFLLLAEIYLQDNHSVIETTAQNPI